MSHGTIAMSQSAMSTTLDEVALEFVEVNITPDRASLVRRVAMLSVGDNAFMVGASTMPFALKFSGSFVSLTHSVKILTSRVIMFALAFRIRSCSFFLAVSLSCRITKRSTRPTIFSAIQI